MHAGLEQINFYGTIGSSAATVGALRRWGEGTISRPALWVGSNTRSAEFKGFRGELFGKFAKLFLRAKFKGMPNSRQLEVNYAPNNMHRAAPLQQ